LRHWTARAFAAVTCSMALARWPLIRRKKETSIPTHDVCGTRRRRSPTALPNDTLHSAVSSTHQTSFVTWNVRRLGSAELSNFSLRCWRRSRLTLALSQYTGLFSIPVAPSWQALIGRSVRWEASAVVLSDLRHRCGGVWGLPRGLRAPSPQCSCSGSRAGQRLGTSVSVLFRSRKACASSSCLSTMTPEALSPSSER
jgi:hypothetical protein